MAGKQIAWDAVGALFRNGMKVMYGGFMGVGTPAGIVEAMCAADLRELELIGNDTGVPIPGVAPLISQRRVRRLVASHIGTNPETGKQMLAGELEVELVPQGTLAERIRCGGAGLGGFLTPTGVGTVVEEGKTRLKVGWTDYLLELPLRADIAIVKAARADRLGNLVYERAARNFNPLIALAADVVIAEVDEIVEPGTLDPDLVMTPGVVVDYIVPARSH
ncbi:acetate CoA-transferase subunit alpha [Rubrivivax gelatinosus]|uniref:3-oxoacid CoA-transferase, A subunit n=1 Tax=Rubrivivax gelatinosus (strain NBRC 100245 / IL144) TaxID=983917 RepID=I0HKE8_RUBGI|nr:acetate CoA-transferase subunit alpha [Rubrivivax gelatinosus]MBG6080107.1 acetate CoA/acetoacetate CoA-transferase alpha subunit [Rubrivivax gelatinosus]BAL93485.1 3-oxoacid CoA-transferase, A subunit [Rubrivivax gelatinosus IL144]